MACSDVGMVDRACDSASEAATVLPPLANPMKPRQPWAEHPGIAPLLQRADEMEREDQLLPEYGMPTPDAQGRMQQALQRMGTMPDPQGLLSAGRLTRQMGHALSGTELPVYGPKDFKIFRDKVGWLG